jgi:hypothetical protein
MHSTLTLRESDPHDTFAIAPEAVPAAWADKVLADIKREPSSRSGSPASLQPPLARSGPAAAAAAPTVDTTFRATAANDIHVPNIHVRNIHVANERPAGPPSTGHWARSTIVAFMFALCSAAAAAAWQHYGDAARQMISAWTPPFALTSSQPPEPTGLAGATDTPEVQIPLQVPSPASTTDQTPPQPAPAQSPAGAAPAAAPASPDATQLQSMAHDLAAMGQEVELLKASIAELKAGQPPMVPRSAETRASVQNPRPKISVPPPRLAAASARRRCRNSFPLRRHCSRCRRNRMTAPWCGHRCRCASSALNRDRAARTSSSATIRRRSQPPIP